MVVVPKSNAKDKYFWEGGGGGASDVRTAKGAWNQNLDKRLIVAGGGGGSSKSDNSKPNSISEDGGDGGGGIGDGDDGRQSFGENAPVYANSKMPGLGGGQTGKPNGNGDFYTCNIVKGGGTLRGGGGYYAGCGTFCYTYTNSYYYMLSCQAESNENTKIDNHCGGGGGGSGYVDKMFSNAGGKDGVRSTHGKIRICVVSSGGTVTHTMKFPQAKYGELSFADSICPYHLVSPAKNANIADYYTLSTFREADGTIIDNRPAIRCGSAGQWEKY